jgi:hypothetical protein
VRLKGETVQTPLWGLEPRQQSFTTPFEGRALEATRVLESEVSSSLFQVSPPHPRDGLRRRHVFIIPRPLCNYVHRIVLQFYVCFYILTSHVVRYFFPVSPLV